MKFTVLEPKDEKYRSFRRALPRAQSRRFSLD